MVFLVDRKRFRPITCRHHAVSMFDKNIPSELQHPLFVINEKDQFSIASAGITVLAGQLAMGVMHRKIDPERASFPGRGIHENDTAMTPDDRVHDGKSETCSAPGFLRGEERIEDPVRDLLADAHPRIRDPERDALVADRKEQCRGKIFRDT